MGECRVAFCQTRPGPIIGHGISSYANSETEAWLQGTVTHVRDVDTVEVNGVSFRLNYLDGPVLDEWKGSDAKRWMVELVLGRHVGCRVGGSTNGEGVVGIRHLTTSEDIGAHAIAAGTARDCPKCSVGRCAPFETQESNRLMAHGYSG